MNKKELIKALTKIRELYPDLYRGMTDEDKTSMANTWYDYFMGADFEFFLKAINSYTKSEHWYKTPSAPALREEYLRLVKAHNKRYKPNRQDYYEGIKDKEKERVRVATEDLKKNCPGYKDIVKEIYAHRATVLSVRSREDYRREEDILYKKKSDLLILYGYERDYDEWHYNCKKCKDSGYTEDGQTCDCYFF